MPVGAIVGIIIGGIVTIFFLIPFIISFIIVLYAQSNLGIHKIKRGWDRNPNPDFMMMIDKDWFKENFQKVQIKSKDKKQLNGYLHKEDSNFYIIFCHGYGGEVVEKTVILRQLNEKYHCNILIIEQRAQLTSKAKIITMGVKEGVDLSLWVSYLVDLNSNAKIMLYGQSMGAATIMNSFNYGHPKNVIGAIEEAGFVNVRKEFYYIARNRVYHPILKYFSFLMCVCYLFLGVNCYKPKIIDGVKKINVPFLVIHGGKDDVVDVNNVKKIIDNISPNIYFQKEIFSNANHCVSYVTEKERYMQLLFSFIDKIQK